MSGVDIKAIRVRCEAATPGPWRLVDSVGVRSTVRLIDANGAEIADLLTDPRDRNETDIFIAAARVDVPALLDELEAARAVVSALTQHRAAKRSRSSHSDAANVEARAMGVGSVWSVAQETEDLRLMEVEALAALAVTNALKAYGALVSK